ncbi:hypothetical protein AGLY_018061 [Aphis glycines]|uniref:Uncharacterized protein n=1 Tax=Aphis glycines TaxID=307491 RepID=A0A6G0STW1_APHGL|nr:hypothetical protein AGLY_018061 [Aphis glycines]
MIPKNTTLLIERQTSHMVLPNHSCSQQCFHNHSNPNLRLDNVPMTKPPLATNSHSLNHKSKRSIHFNLHIRPPSVEIIFTGCTFYNRSHAIIQFRIAFIQFNFRIYRYTKTDYKTRRTEFFYLLLILLSNNTLAIIVPNEFDIVDPVVERRMVIIFVPVTTCHILLSNVMLSFENQKLIVVYLINIRVKIWMSSTILDQYRSEILKKIVYEYTLNTYGTWFSIIENVSFYIICFCEIAQDFCIIFIAILTQ